MLHVERADAQLFTQTFVNGLLHVHSVFKRSINLQDFRSKQLIMLTFQSAEVPHCMVVSYEDFVSLKSELKVGTQIILQQRILYFPKTALSFQHANAFVTSLAVPKQVLNLQCLSFVIQQIENVTGFQEPLQQVFTSRNPFYQAVDDLHSSSFYQQRLAIDFLIGRGIGLTPTGDDMLLGYLVASCLTQRQNLRLAAYLKRKLTTVKDLTTDVSLHYLLQAIDGNFSQTYAQIGRCRDQQTTEIVLKSILLTGHTSGADFLAGVMRSLFPIKQ